jgi:adenylyltransferase/sulfurtransferase
MHRFEGQLTTIRPGGPCLRCIHPEPPAPGAVPDCSEAGVLGAMAGVLGTMQAVEVVKEILDLGTGLSGRLLLYDALGQRLEEIAVARDPACPVCGER